MYRQGVAWSVGLCLLVPFAWPQVPSSAFTPDQLVEAAMARNREFLSFQQRVREAQGLRKQAGVGLADNLQLSGIGGQPVGNAGEDNFSIAYSHTFETFGKRSKRMAIADKEIALAQAELNEHRRTLAFEVKLRYAEAAVEQQKMAVIDRLLAGLYPLSGIAKCFR
jgi:outer membrane protein, heavy metal efflux system